MLTEMYQALAAVLAPMNIPLYLSDCVPDGTGFPYLAADYRPHLTHRDEGQLSLTIWCCGDTANADRFRLTEELLSYLPPRGLRLTLDSGAVVLRMADTVSFLHDREARGAKTSWTLRCCPAPRKE